MDIDSFIDLHRPEWRRLEAAVARGGRGLASRSGQEIDDTIRSYLRTSAHLSQARGQFSDPSLERYLNGLVLRAHAAIYGTRPRTLRGAVRFFGTRYREAIRRTAPFIAVAAALLVAVVVAATVWVLLSREARVGLLPPQAREAIRRATGARAESVLPNAGLSSFILLNNVQVAFLAFATGIALGVGTIYFVVQNALLLGILAGAFQAAGKAWPFWSLILPHGLLELTAICIAAGAGLRMGWSIVDPGNRPRSTALAEEARDAVLVVIGVIPAFAVAALIEGYLTGNAPAWVTVPVGIVVALAYVAFLGVPRRRRAAPAAWETVTAGPPP